MRIKNFVIIEDMVLNFKNGLNILTGETGAGKSILIGALSGILGDRMTTDMIRTGFEKATLEGLFDITSLNNIKEILDDSGIDYEDDNLILRRELFSSGRGRCFANSVQIPISKLKAISEYLVDIHGQNEHQNIVKISKHREILDSFAGHNNHVKEIRGLYNKLYDLKEKLNSFEIDEREKARRIEFNQFAINEIETADLKSGEVDELKNESNLLANAERLFQEINSSSTLTNGDNGIINKLRVVEQGLSKVSEYDTEISGVIDTIKECLYSLEDVSGFLRDYESGIDFSPERINQVEARLSLISTLKKKYGDTIEDILEYKGKLKKELDAISSSDEELEKLNNEYKITVQKTKKSAIQLTEKRISSAKKLDQLVIKELSDLGMSGTVFNVSISQEQDPEGEIEADNKRYALYPHGLDKIEFLLSANAGEDLRQLRKVASGGEMSRIMLAIKNVILSSDIVDTLIFDEVDAGISGKIAEIVGKKLKLLAKDRQVLIITHLPQIAAMSDNHFSVQKGIAGERVQTMVKELSQKEKVKEVARMLAGEKVTDLSIQHAEEMVALAESF